MASIEDALANLDREALRALLERALEQSGHAPSPLPDGAESATLVLSPREEGMAAKDIPVDTLLKKVTMIRDRLRVSEQRINAAELPTRETLELQSSVTELYRVLSAVSSLLAAPKDQAQS